MQLLIRYVLVFAVLFISSASSLWADTKILILGDSLSTGFRIAEKDSYPSLLEQHFLQNKNNITILNASVSGSTSSSGLKRLKFALRAKPEVLILALGANDGLRGGNLKSMQKNLRKILELAQAQKMKILLIGMHVPPNYGKKYSAQFQQSFLTLAKQYHTYYMPFLLQGVAGHAEYNLPDGIHPNAKGQKIIFQNILPYLTELLKEKK